VWISFCDETLSNFIKTKHPKKGENKEQKGRTHIIKKRELVHYFYHILVEHAGKIICLFFILLGSQMIFKKFPQYMAGIKFSGLRLKKEGKKSLGLGYQLKLTY
jgi:hypothetical protein